jgi:cytidine deaminase
MSISDDDLISAASDARRNAYARYSDYRVGAALIDDRGHLHVGCNVENAAYPLGNCAEASAIAAMVQQGGKRIVKIAVVGGGAEIGPCTPCGGCRQRISEFADDETIILSIDDSGDWQRFSIEQLLPASFHLP